MKDLKQLQTDFADYLMGNRESTIVADIISDEKADSAERMGFYHDAYRLRLIDVMSKDYPVVAKLLGEQEFAKMTLAYLRSYPSKYKSVRWFGIHLPKFLQANDKDKEKGEQLLEVAQFEKAQNDVFDAQQSEVVVLDQLAAINPAEWVDMRISLISACQMLNLHNNVPTVWLELFNQENDDIEPQSADWVRKEHPATWLVWRGGLDPKWRLLEVDEAWAIQAFENGQSFGEICTGLTEWIDEEHVPMRAVSILKSLILDEVVSAIDVAQK